MFGLLKKLKKQPEYKLESKVFYSVETGILSNYFPYAADVHNYMIKTYDAEQCYVQYYFDALTPVAVILWIDNWQSNLSEEERLELFTVTGVPVTKKVHILAFEVNKFLRKKGYGRAVLKHFVSDKEFVAIEAAENVEGFYRKCGFVIDKFSNYYFFVKGIAPKKWDFVFKKD